MNTTGWVVLASYVFIALGVYFVLRVKYNEADDEEDKLAHAGMSIFWIAFVGAGIVVLPFWILDKAAKAVIQSIREVAHRDDKSDTTHDGDDDFTLWY